MKLIECVPNFSEGRDEIIINKIIDSIKTVENIHLLDVDPGKTTNRTVVTFVGTPESVLIAAFNGIKTASKLINMKIHKGEHPRMGATDVCPLIPVSNVTMKECINLSHKLAKMVSDKLNIQVFMYENSAKHKDRSNLSNIRKGEYEGMETKVNDSSWIPDYGNNILFNKKSGVTAIGAREYLIAYNINLNTQNKKIATDIALDIREAGRAKRDNNGKILRDKSGSIIKKPGKLKFCKAVGWYIDEYNIAQVSINLTNFKKTSMHKTFEEVRRQARKRGLRVTGSEVVGLLPKKALIDAGNYYLSKQNESLGIPEIDIIKLGVSSLGLNEINTFKIKEKLIEYVIDNTNNLPALTIDDFINEVSRSSATPGGGSVAALVGSLGAALSSMVSNLTINKKGFERFNKLHQIKSKQCQVHKDELLKYVDKDTNAYNDVINAIRLPKKSKKEITHRNKKIYEANINAAQIPLEILEKCNILIHETLSISENCNPNSISDIAVANDLIYAAAKGASYNIIINLSLANKKDKERYSNSVEYYIKQIEDVHLKISTITNNILF